MNGDKFLLDTNAVLYLLKGDETPADFIFEEQIHISIITVKIFFCKIQSLINKFPLFVRF